jgi:hypothetical protein
VEPLEQGAVRALLDARLKRRGDRVAQLLVGGAVGLGLEPLLLLAFLALLPPRPFAQGAIEVQVGCLPLLVGVLVKRLVL